MRILLEKINNNLSYQYDGLKSENNLIDINSFSMLSRVFENSYNPIKIINGFEKTLLEWEKNVFTKPLYFVDHSNYSNLFLLFNDEKQIIEYVQDTCEARGDTIPKNWDSVLNYLIQENTYLFKIVEFNISLKEFKDYFNQ